ncbi:hypothetical protein ABT297_36530 [Dactylosporangium sp. NPDC000555]|uniref:hypothetical protein n=1 Tax=Dactylosporangium sp. NPDC000555 TaxID=3154260 RepID=UPI00332DD9DC
MKRTGPLIVLVLVLVVAGAVVGHLLGRSAGSGPGRLRPVSAIVGSEKTRFFADPDVRQVLARHGWSVRADAAGSRQMPARTAGYDFAFPGSKAAADEIRRHAKPAGDDVVVFSSPLAVATFVPIVDLLQNAHLAARDAGGVWRLDLKALADANRRDLKWTDIQGNTAHRVTRNVLVATTRPADSNSAAMYAVLLDQATGGDLAAVAKLFTDQGAVDTTSEEPFESYLRSGRDSAPMVLVYEAQFVDHAVNDGLTGGQTLMYPTPTLVCEHTIVPLTQAGVEIAKLLATDHDLQLLAARHGFRTADATLTAPVFGKVRPGDAPLPDSIDGAVPDPDYKTQHTLLAKLEERMS